MNRFQKAAAAAALVGTTLVGGAVGATMVGTAGAQDDTTTSSVPQAGGQDAPSGQPPGGPDAGRAPSGPHSANGVTEELLTGDTATRVTEAAGAAVEGGTVDRVETDAEGAAYEAHVTRADGSRVTVKLDAAFDVTSVEEGNC